MGASGRTLTDDQRQRAFLIAAAIVVGVVLLTGLLNGGHGAPRRAASAATRATPSAPRIVNAGAEQTSTSTSTPATVTATAARVSSQSTPGAYPSLTAESPLARRGGSLSPSARTLILGRARTFLAAYLASQVRPLDLAMRTALSQTATAGLARRLTRHPVKQPPSERSAIGQVESLQLRNTSTSKTITVDATVGRSGWISALSLDFDDVDGQWLVSNLS